MRDRVRPNSIGSGWWAEYAERYANYSIGGVVRDREYVPVRALNRAEPIKRIRKNDYEYLFLLWVERTDRILSEAKPECVFWTSDEEEAQRFVKFATDRIGKNEKVYYTKTERL